MIRFLMLSAVCATVIPDELERLGSSVQPHVAGNRPMHRDRFTNQHACGQVSRVPSDVRQWYQLSSFYQKYTHAYGIPILSSLQASDKALQRACYIVRFMLADREDLRRAQYYNKGRVAIMATYPREMTTHIPEHRFLDPNFWNERARGLGGTLHLPLTTGAEENVLCLPSDRYKSQDILLHEFAHGVNLVSAESVDRRFKSRMAAAYNSALRRGLWARTYAATNPVEYFAVGTQAYFNQGKNGPFGGDGVHNHVDTRDELRTYDPTLFAILREVFPCGNFPIDRCERAQDFTGPINMNCDGNGGGGSKPETTLAPPSTPPPPTSCEDGNQHCTYWARIGECSSNPVYMDESCRKSCGKCSGGGGGSNCRDENQYCSSWARSGECSRNPAYMHKSCTKSCNKC